jgi:hypothetical protein
MGAGAVVILAIVAALVAHPIHTTMTELVVDRARGSVRATVRGFQDDLGAAAGTNGVEKYVAARLRLIGAGGLPIGVRECGTRRAGDVVWVCVEATYRGDPAGLKVANSLLCDRFADQVNIVQVEVDGSRRSLVFTKGDGNKPVL